MSYTINELSTNIISQGSGAASVSFPNNIKVNNISELTGSAKVSFPNNIKVDSVSELTGSAKVSFPNDIKVDNINESTANAQVSFPNNIKVDTINELTASNTVHFPNNIKTNNIFAISSLIGVSNVIFNSTGYIQIYNYLSTGVLNFTDATSNPPAVPLNITYHYYQLGGLRILQVDPMHNVVSIDPNTAMYNNVSFDLPPNDVVVLTHGSNNGLYTIIPFRFNKTTSQIQMFATVNLDNFSGSINFFGATLVYNV